MRLELNWFAVEDVRTASATRLDGKRLDVGLDGLTTLAVFLALSYAIFAGTLFAINEIAKGHAASRGNPPHSSTAPRS